MLHKLKIENKPPANLKLTSIVTGDIVTVEGLVNSWWLYIVAESVKSLSPKGTVSTIKDACSSLTGGLFIISNLR